MKTDCLVFYAVSLVVQPYNGVKKVYNKKRIKLITTDVTQCFIWSALTHLYIFEGT